jgi:hypothetical protein
VSDELLPLKGYVEIFFKPMAGAGSIRPVMGLHGFLHLNAILQGGVSTG